MRWARDASVPSPGRSRSSTSLRPICCPKTPSATRSGCSGPNCAWPLSRQRRCRWRRCAAAPWRPLRTKTSRWCCAVPTSTRRVCCDHANGRPGIDAWVPQMPAGASPLASSLSLPSRWRRFAAVAQGLASAAPPAQAEAVRGRSPWTAACGWCLCRARDLPASVAADFQIAPLRGRSWSTRNRQGSVAGQIVSPLVHDPTAGHRA